MPLDPQLHVFGLASARVVATCAVAPAHLEMCLMDFLRQHNIPVASSCFGEGVCGKCRVLDRAQTAVLSCQISVGDYLVQHGDSIAISYL